MELNDILLELTELAKKNNNSLTEEEVENKIDNVEDLMTTYEYLENLNIEVVMSSSTKCYLNDMKGNKELINKIGDMGLYLTCDLDMDTIDSIYNLKI